MGTHFPPSEKLPDVAPTSPRRKRIRETVAERIIENAEKMKIKYSSAKRIKVRDHVYLIS